MCSICQNLYSDGGDYLSLLYRKSLIYAIKTYYILVFFVVRGFYAYQLKQGHQKPSTSKTIKACGQMHYSVLIYTYVDTRKESAKDESREKI